MIGVEKTAPAGADGIPITAGAGFELRFPRHMLPDKNNRCLTRFWSFKRCATFKALQHQAGSKAQDQSVKDRFDGKRSLKATHECLKRQEPFLIKNSHRDYLNGCDG